MNLISFYSNVQAQVKGRNIYPQYSSHQELNGEQREPREPRPSNTGRRPNNPEHRQSSSHNPQQAKSTSNRQEDDNEANRILLVTIQNPLYPITVDVLCQVFSPHGTIEKVVIFNKTAGLQALVQYSTVQNAVAAKNTLQGQNIYAGSCTLLIQFSNLQNLTVHQNTDKSRDFLNPSLPTEAPNRRNEGASIMGPGTQVPTNQFSQMTLQQQLSQLAALPVVQQLLAAQQQQQQQQQASGQLSNGLSIPSLASVNTDRSVLLVSNLNPEKTTCDALFNLFSNYGNVVRIKILHNKRDHALIQLGDNIQSTTALNYLKHVVMFGRTIDVNYSKHPAISSNPDLSAQDTLKKDYTNSPLNRFVRNAQRNYKHICPPGPMIHLSNLAPSLTKESITDLFSPFGTIVNAKIFEVSRAGSTKRQCLVQFSEVSSAIDAVCSMHNKSVEGSNLSLRVAFSKSTI
eukprot:CAMPEP_0184675362 /NCGR_PEP_ID=MMETSP0308-20130426/87685_1 /TAXON_ID=38269 /ORGANISM="Gloeochaete witrockiana, Strain SAG 46.84" /LENGTH=457 /DNA_ID=CAMNT_0027123061 /DNA_START=582 /DNA_END=1955 /DNA_ORIENTATION=+